VRRSSINYQPDVVRAQFRGRIADDTRMAVYSEEDLSAYKFLDAETSALRMKDVFGAYDILFIARRQVDWITSLYYFYISTFRAEVMHGINHWLAQELHFRVGSAIAQMQMAAMLRAYTRCNDESKILVLPLEQLSSNAEAFLTAIASFLRVDAAEMMRLNQQGIRGRNASKQRIHKAEADFIRTLRHLLDKDHAAFRRDMQRFLPHVRDTEVRDQVTTALRDLNGDYAGWAKLIRAASATLDTAACEVTADGADDKITGDLLTRVNGLSKRSNRELMRQFDVDLRPYGYEL
jgi:hypothetical protein